MPFKKGQSGNPGGGRVQSRSVTLLAREYTDDAMETLIAIMEDPDAPKSSRVSAAQTVLDRGWGKAPQTVNVSTNPFEDMDADSKRTMLEALRIISGDEAVNAPASGERTH